MRRSFSKDLMKVMKDSFFCPQSMEKIKDKVKLSEKEFEKSILTLKKAGIVKVKDGAFHLLFNEKTIRWLAALSAKECEDYFKERRALYESVRPFKVTAKSLPFLKTAFFLPLSLRSIALFLVLEKVHSLPNIYNLSKLFNSCIHLFYETSSSFLFTLKTSLGEKVIKDAKILFGEEEFWHLAFFAKGDGVQSMQ
jgi:biotin operon repressor